MVSLIPQRRRNGLLSSGVETGEGMRQPRDSRTDLVSWSLPRQASLYPSFCQHQPGKGRRSRPRPGIRGRPRWVRCRWSHRAGSRRKRRWIAPGSVFQSNSPGEFPTNIDRSRNMPHRHRFSTRQMKTLASRKLVSSFVRVHDLLQSLHSKLPGRLVVGAQLGKQIGAMGTKIVILKREHAFT